VNFVELFKRIGPSFRKLSITLSLQIREPRLEQGMLPQHHGEQLRLLSSYKPDADAAGTILQIIGENCRNLKFLHFDAELKGKQKPIRSVAILPKLETLHISTDNKTLDDALLNFIIFNRSNLKCLKIKDCLNNNDYDEITEEPFKNLPWQCRNIRNLELSSCVNVSKYRLDIMSRVNSVMN